MNLILIGVLLFTAAGIISAFACEKHKGTVFLSFSSIAWLLTIPVLISSVVTGNTIGMQINFNNPIGTAFLRIDPIASFFLIIITTGTLLASVYSAGYMKHYSDGKYSLSAFYIFFGILASSMMLVVTVQNAFLFLIVWEIMSVSSFFLVIFEGDKEEVRKAGLYYLISMQIGAAFLIAGFAWITNLSGSNDFESFRNILSSPGYIPVILFFLFFIGFGTKAGFVPFHTWLPKAHPAAPTGVSAIMSGVMIKTGIYGILRIIILRGTIDAGTAYAVFIVSFITSIIGIINAIPQKDIKSLLAYSSIENIGIIGMGIGLGMLGTAYNLPLITMLGYLGALLHTLNHFIFKSMLFYGAGIVYQNTGTKNMELLGGLMKFMPFTAGLFFIGTMAISGLPLFNGFIGEFAIYLGMAKTFSMPNVSLNIVMLIGFAGLALIGIMSMLAFTKLFGITFLGTPRSTLAGKVHDGSPLVIIPMAILAVFVFFIGLFPAPLINVLDKVVGQFSTDGANRLEPVASLYSYLTQGILIFAVLVLFFIVLRQMLLKGKKVSTYKTWDCGYQAESSRVQYTGNSYSLPFLELVAEFVPQKTQVESRTEIFPEEISLSTSQHDFTENMIVKPVVKFVRNFLTLFAQIQSGKMQQYILYGLIFLIAIIIWVIGVM